MKMRGEGPFQKFSEAFQEQKQTNQTKHAPTSKTSYVQIIKMMPKKE